MSSSFSLFVAVLAVCIVGVIATDPISPDTWCLNFDTDVNPTGTNTITFNITREWAPLGADRVYALVGAHFFDQLPAAFFRVVPQFVTQFGLSGVPQLNAKWSTMQIPDDPVLKSNTMGTLTFATAGPNTRTTQLFFNQADNAFLDSQGFAPLGIMTGGGVYANAIFNPTPGDSGGVPQDQYSENGFEWIEKTYPGINSIVKAYVTLYCEAPAPTHRRHPH